MLNDADRAYLKSIQSCELELDRWRVRVQSIESPEVASDLSADDQVFPHHRISEVVRASLAISGEHLRMALDAIYRGNLYPGAHFTTLRSALVGACQGVWILTSDDATTRRERGLCVIEESYKRSAQFHAGTRALASNLTSSDISALDSQLAWIAGRRQLVAQARSTVFSLNLTSDVIPSAADAVYSDAERRAQVRLLWRQMSGDAHVLGWSMFMRSVAGRLDRLSGLTEFAAGGSFEAIAQPFIASHEILRHGWRLYDRRCEGRD